MVRGGPRDESVVVRRRLPHEVGLQPNQLLQYVIDLLNEVDWPLETGPQDYLSSSRGRQYYVFPARAGRHNTSRAGHGLLSDCQASRLSRIARWTQPL